MQLVEVRLGPALCREAGTSGLDGDTELEDLTGGSADDNARTLRDVLGGSSNGPFRDVVLLNAAGAIGTILGDLEASLVKARESLESGAALAKLEALVSTSQRLANAA